MDSESLSAEHDCPTECLHQHTTFGKAKNSHRPVPVIGNCHPVDRRMDDALTNGTDVASREDSTAKIWHWAGRRSEL